MFCLYKIKHMKIHVSIDKVVKKHKSVARKIKQIQICAWLQSYRSKLVNSVQLKHFL